MRYADYENWLVDSYISFVHGPYVSEIGPLYGPTVTPPPYAPWRMKWAVFFEDGHHFVVTENWSPVKGTQGQFGERNMFAFHYGPTNPLSDRFGFPTPDSIKYPAIIRIDKDYRPGHLHYRGEDHIFQHRVRGFDIERDACPFAFASAVFQHRRTHAEFDTILGFEVT